jgi:radical SAM-linked protein
MFRYRVIYAKEGPARYISHLDLLRVFDRAARRGGLPVAYTQGFNPHPKMSFAAPLSVGTEGEAEFADMELTRDIPVADMESALGGSMPQGLRLIGVSKAPEAAPALMAMVDRATYSARARLASPLPNEELAKAIEVFLARPQIIVERRGKAGEKKLYDIKPGIFAMSGSVNNDIIVIKADIKTGSSGNVRFEELLAAFLEESLLPLQGRFVLARTGLLFKRS